MTLEFHPPFQINPYAPTRTDRSLAQLNQTFKDIGDTATQYSQQQRQSKIQQAMAAIAQQRSDEQHQDWLRTNTGTLPNFDQQSSGGPGDNPSMGPQPTGSFTPGANSPAPMSAPPIPGHDQPMSYADNIPTSYPSGQSSFPQMTSAGTPDTGWPQQPPQARQPGQPWHAPGTDLTAHFNNWTQQGGGPYNHQEMGGNGQPARPNPMAGFDWSTYANIPGSKNREEYRLFQDEARKQREEQDKYNGGANSLYFTPERAANALYPTDSAKQQAALTNLQRLYPDGRIPKSDVTIMGSGIRSGATIGERDNQFAGKRLTALGDALDPSKQRAGAFGVSKQVYDRAERLESLASAFKDGNLDSRQVEELAIGLNAMLSGSNTGSQQQVKSLVPQSVMGNAQKFAEWLTNEPRGLQQQAFVGRMLGSIGREKATASDQMKRTQFQRIGRYADLERSDPDGFTNVLQSSGIDPDEYRTWKKGGYKSMTAVQSPDSSGGKIRVSNGRETLLIDPVDAASAAKDGYR